MEKIQVQKCFAATVPGTTTRLTCTGLTGVSRELPALGSGSRTRSGHYLHMPSVLRLRRAFKSLLQVVGLNCEGYGLLLQQCNFSAGVMYALWCRSASNSQTSDLTIIYKTKLQSGRETGSVHHRARNSHQGGIQVLDSQPHSE